jgi:ATP-dependent DNA helicase RecG
MIKLSDIKGIGPKTASLLNKLDIYNIDDLISYYPYRYNLLKRADLTTCFSNESVIIDGIIETIPSLYRFGKMNKMTFRLNTYESIINVTIFNRGFLKNKLLPNTKIIIFGKYDRMHNSFMASELRFGILPQEPVIEPVYHTTNGISSKQIKTYIDVALNQDINISSNIPLYLQDRYNFIDKNTSIKIIHNPKSDYELRRALDHLKYEELFNFMLKLNKLKMTKQKEKGIKRDVNYSLIENKVKELPFELTIDQQSALKEIYSDLIDEHRMNRLLQGDVGSGKTIIAFLSLYINYLSGYQGSLMAPTDVLAKQHYNNFKKIFKDLKVVLLTGKIKKQEQKKIHQDIQDGKVDIIIGTHALISEEVSYYKLGLVITDEQHRFGVNQRLALQNKGLTPDVLYMSATPIPRTYALTIYGDMDMSIIKTMPKGRKDIKTILKTSNEIKEVLELMYNELKNNHQVYVIAPLIEDSDKIELINISDLEEKMNRAFGKLFKIATMHGKMDQLEKEVVMTKFINNEINILISTTVIEVGVDVPNATMIVIFDSFRFGLSTLHQLRGRVGRSDIQSYCVLLSDMEKERLNILTNTNDGFKISEEDFKLRGSGDLFGVRQSGEMLFKLVDIHQDYDLLSKTKEDSYEYLQNNIVLLDK